MLAPMTTSRLWAVGLLVLLASCAALRDDMKRAETAFDQARYEDVTVWLDELEPSVADMEKPMRARFYYLRGLTAFRLGERTRARHYLALCREEAGPEQASLRPEWRTNMTSALAELTRDPRNPEALPNTSAE
jgi:hypothetical protein